LVTYSSVGGHGRTHDLGDQKEGTGKVMKVTRLLEYALTD